MGNNSIRSNLSKDDIISDIVLSMGADIYRENIYILLEGEDDISFLHPYVSDNVLLYESYDGKNGVEAIVSERFADNDRVIGIRDKDYQIRPISEKIFYYDYGCMEMMLVSNDDVFDNLCFEYYRGNTTSKQLKKHILEQLKYLSSVRMCNEIEQWGIALKGVSVNQAWDSTQLVMNNDIILKKINSMNNNFITGEVLKKIEEEYSKHWSDDNYYFNTQGHDFFTLFATVCNQYKKKGIKYTEVQASARCIFRWSDLLKTEMYCRIKEYSQVRNLSILCVVA